MKVTKKVKVVEVAVYETSDGTMFEHEWEAKDHEAETVMRNIVSFDLPAFGATLYYVTDYEMFKYYMIEIMGYVFNEAEGLRDDMCIVYTYNGDVFAVSSDEADVLKRADSIMRH